MKVKLLILILGLFAACGVSSQSFKVHVDKKGKVGFVDENGVEVIKCQYSSAKPFENGIAIVSKSGKYGCIDETGKVVMPLVYSHISELNENLFLIKAGKKVGVADKFGNIIHQAKYSFISKFNCYGKAIIAVGGKLTSDGKNKYMMNAKYGIIDKNGKIIIEPIHKGLYEFAYDCKSIMPYNEGKRLLYSYHNLTDTLQTDCSYLGFSKYGTAIYKCGILDSVGNVLLNMGLYDIVMMPRSGVVRYYETKKKETTCGYHNLSTNNIIIKTVFNQAMDKINFFTHGDFIANIAPINGKTWTFVNKEGEVQRKDYETFTYNEHIGLWAAKNASGKWDVFDGDNNEIEALSGYDDIYFPSQKGDKNIFTVKNDNLYGCIDINGDTIIPFEYEQAHPNNYDVVLVKKNGKWGALTPSNDTIIPIKYIDIMFPDKRGVNNFWVKKSDSLFYHYNTKEERLSSTGYKAVANFVNGLAHVRSDDMNISDTPLIRAQIFAPNASVESVKIEDYKESFGYLLNVNDELVINQPISTLYKDKFVKEIMKYDYEKLSESEKKRILLEITRDNRVYDLKSEIGAEEWDY